MLVQVIVQAARVELLVPNKTAFNHAQAACLCYVAVVLNVGSSHCPSRSGGVACAQQNCIQPCTGKLPVLRLRANQPFRFFRLLAWLT